jgi:hypothetical protein
MPTPRLHSLHYICEFCNGEWRFAAISGPKKQPALAVVRYCPFCGHVQVRFLPDTIAKGATAS